MATARNPIIRGFNPDPSICRVGDDFYLVTSTFEFFPGVPIYHSRDLAHWRLIGHCLTRPEQLKLDGIRASGGIYAPTLRYHEGTFYMITTLVDGGGNFLVTALAITGPWSDPVWIDQPGIDPDLFFEDGKCYLLTSASVGREHFIMQSVIDPKTGAFLSEKTVLCRGTGGSTPEGAHMYRIGSWHYLTVAEGGTEYGHMVTIFRSKSVTGPFEPCPHNPILTQVGLKSQFDYYRCSGHADMVQDPNGAWWMVCLAVRPLPGLLLHNLGRETFLSRVTWTEDGWPVINENGTLISELETGLPEWTDEDTASRDTYIRTPDMSCYEDSRIIGKGVGLSMPGVSPAFKGVRQEDFKGAFTARVSLSGDGLAGITAFYNHDHHYDVILRRRDGQSFVTVRKRLYDMECETACVPIDGKSAQLRITMDKQNYSFFYHTANGWQLLGQGAAAGLCTEITRTMTFTGVFLGRFCEEGEAAFDEPDICYA
ncbi:MAG: family 43 glycosylhydrolase [Clostridia bacterium]|nr:family 43 glycosylhydrolase [Clostridia bacterium]